MARCKQPEPCTGVGLHHTNRCVIGRVSAKCCLESHHGINGVADVVVVNTAVKQLSCIEPLPLLLDAIAQLPCEEAAVGAQDRNFHSTAGAWRR